MAKVRMAVVLGALAALSLGAASPASAATGTLPVPDSADLTLSFTHVKATKKAPGRKRAKAPKVRIRNGSSLPQEMKIYQGLVRTKGKRREFDVAVIQMRPAVANPAASSPPLIFEVDGRSSRRYRIGKQRIFKNFSEEASAASLAKIPLRIAPTSTGARASQIDVGALIRAIICPILNQLANGPFGAFIGPLINSLRAAFGCIDPNAAPPFADIAAQNGLKGGTPPAPPPTPPPPTPPPPTPPTCTYSLAHANTNGSSTTASYNLSVSCSAAFSTVFIDPPDPSEFLDAGDPSTQCTPRAGPTTTCTRTGGFGTSASIPVEVSPPPPQPASAWSITTTFNDGQKFTGSATTPP